MTSFVHIREFLVFARYLSISKAADVLFTSQSNLSKHIRQLENDLGFKLTCKSGNRILLTEEGTYFLSGIQSIVSDYDELVRNCTLIKGNSQKRIVLQEPPYSDLACNAFYGIAGNLRELSKHLFIDFVHEKSNDRQALLMEDKMQVLLEYHCGNPRTIVEAYRKRGILAVEIAQEPLVAWGKRFMLERSGSLDVSRLRELSIMVLSDASSIMNTLISELPDVIGFAPRVFVSTAGTATQYYYSEHKQSVYLLPQSYSTASVFTTRKDMCAVPFANNAISCRAFALINTKGEHFELLQPIIRAAQLTEGDNE